METLDTRHALLAGAVIAAAGVLIASVDRGAAEDEREPVEPPAPVTRTAEPPGGTPPQQARRTLVLPEKGREAVLEEMRLMLEALHGVIVATAEGDRQAMAREARSGGSVIAVDTDPAIAKRLPAEFVSLGSATHHHFDSLAARIEGGIGRDSVLSELGTLTNKCVACHSGYRVVTPAMAEGGQ